MTVECADAYEIFQAMIDSLSYNRETEDMLQLCTELRKRIAGEYVEFSDDGNIVYGTLVMLYGEYGTSPRTGWFESDETDALNHALDGIEKSIKTRADMEYRIEKLNRDRVEGRIEE